MDIISLLTEVGKLAFSQERTFWERLPARLFILVLVIVVILISIVISAGLLWTIASLLQEGRLTSNFLMLIASGAAIGWFTGVVIGWVKALYEAYKAEADLEAVIKDKDALERIKNDMLEDRIRFHVAADKLEDYITTQKLSGHEIAKTLFDNVDISPDNPDVQALLSEYDVSRIEDKS